MYMASIIEGSDISCVDLNLEPVRCVKGSTGLIVFPALKSADVLAFQIQFGVIPVIKQVTGHTCLGDEFHTDIWLLCFFAGAVGVLMFTNALYKPRYLDSKANRYRKLLTF